MIAAVGQEMDFRCRWRRIGENPHAAFALLQKRVRYLQCQVIDQHACGGLGHALLQQQVCRLEQGAGHEAPLHGAVLQQIDQRQQAHSLMMRHE